MRSLKEQIISYIIIIMSSNLKILGVKIDNLSHIEILEKIESFLESNSFHQIITTNAEFILKAQEDKNFQKIVNEADLSVADSIAIKYAFFRYFHFLKTRIAGIDLMQEILKLAEEKKISIFLVSRKNGLSNWQETKDAILKKFPNLDIEGIDVDVLYFFEKLQNFKFKIDDEFFSDIFKNDKLEIFSQNKNFSKKWIVFCNFGMPEQDKFINFLKSSNFKICLGMGVGGSFDFLTGKVKRAPKFMRFFGLEWFFRLIQYFFIKQPKNNVFKSNRLQRIFRAVIIFPIKVILNK